MGMWNEFTRFLSDVRAEMRKVVAPSRKEVQATTTVVIVAVFLFGAVLLRGGLRSSDRACMRCWTGWADCSNCDERSAEIENTNGRRSWNNPASRSGAAG